MAEVSTVKPRSVELINEKEREIKFYQTYLDKLAQGKSISSEIFTNRGEAHASILMATLLANTTNTLKLYCRGLTPGLLCGKTEGDGEGFEGAYWAEFKQFFQSTIKSERFGTNSVEILIQEDKYLEYQPFQTIKQALQNEAIKSKIKIKKITDGSKKDIERVLGNGNGENYNFAIFDGHAFRLEYNPDDYQAIGSFNNPTWCNLLTKLFDSAFSKATEISLV
jgi:hypothetical protein